MKGGSTISEDPDVFNVIVMDRIFKLSKSQIERDSPNYFTFRFFDPQGERKIQVLEISRDPFLFLLVLRYLNGYQVFPIHPNQLPPCSSLETTVTDLCTDAEFYGLDGLVRLCSLQENLLNKRADTLHTTPMTGPRGLIPKAQLSIRYAVITGHVRVLADKFQLCKLVTRHDVDRISANRRTTPLAESFDKCIPRFAISLLSESQFKSATTGAFIDVSDAKLTPERLSAEKPELLIVRGWSEHISRAVVRRDTVGVERWELMGWKRDWNENLRHVAIFIKMWATPGFEIVH